MASHSFERPRGIRTLMGGLALAAVILALSFAVTWPIWSLATSHRRLYTVSMLCLLAGSACALALRGIIRRAAGSGRRVRRRRER